MEKLYKKMNDQISPDPRLKSAVMEQAVPRKRLNFRPLSAVAAMLAVLLMATPVMAAYVEPINELLYQISPEMAGRFTPVRKSCVKNGIKMEVLSASVHGNVAEMVVSFEDLEGNRVTDTFLPEFEIRDYRLFGNQGGGMSVGGLSEDHSGYDPETGIRTFLLSKFYLGADVADLLGNKITLISDFATKSNEPQTYTYPLELVDREVMTVKVERGQPTDHAVEVPFDGFGYGSREGYEEWNRREEYSILTPGEAAFAVTEDAVITGIAFVDGQLHIQSRTRKDTTGCNASLVDSDGNILHPQMYNNFVIEEGDNWGWYREEVFDISPEEMENYTLQVLIQTSDTIGGPWKVTFEFTECDYEGDVVTVETEVPVYE